MSTIRSPASNPARQAGRLESAASSCPVANSSNQRTGLPRARFFKNIWNLPFPGDPKFSLDVDCFFGRSEATDRANARLARRELPKICHHAEVKFARCY